MLLIDSHCHLDFPEFDDDRDELLKTCRQNGITRFIVPGVSCHHWPRLQKISMAHVGIFPAFGLHPYFMAEHQFSHIDELAQIVNCQRPIAIGEIGLDYFSGPSNKKRDKERDKEIDKEKQQSIFHAQLALAKEFDLPVILHVRKAHDDVLRALRQYKVKGGTAHAFNGSFQQAEQYIRLGFKLGFGGALTFNRALHLRKLATHLPLESMVLETDSPDMRPANDKSSRNTPLTMIPVLETLDSLRTETIEQIGQRTTDNLITLFELS